jgi:hypothetical protein
LPIGAELLDCVKWKDGQPASSVIDGKFYLDVPEELRNRTLQTDFAIIIDGVDYWRDEHPAIVDGFLYMQDFLQDMRAKYQDIYQTHDTRKVPIAERLTDKAEAMREINAIAQRYDLSGDELKSFIKLIKGMADTGTDTFDTYGNSNLLNISDERRRNSYYERLFVTDYKAVNYFMQESSTLSGKYEFSLEFSVARYEELRDETIKTFAGDKDLLDKNLESLDAAFAQHLERRVALVSARALESDKTMANWAKNSGNEIPYELNKIAIHKSFNMDKFHANAQEMMKQFAQEYLQQIKGGAGYASAWENAVAIMTRSTETTSVNKLSFSDYMILEASIQYTGNTKAQMYASHSSLNNAFNNNTNLSESLRKALNIG